jgi:hypothetical protein
MRKELVDASNWLLNLQQEPNKSQTISMRKEQVDSNPV